MDAQSTRGQPPAQGGWAVAGVMPRAFGAHCRRARRTPAYQPRPSVGLPICPARGLFLSPPEPHRGGIGACSWPNAGCSAAGWCLFGAGAGAGACICWRDARGCCVVVLHGPLITEGASTHTRAGHPNSGPAPELELELNQLQRPQPRCQL